ncbi:SGNH/GDSL hydrolase family protein [Lactobacillus sp. YT155]|uniref:SGNH/GDSL hydrolase family protein n=1 Tax=Lactobacillus sp. YT155 TaxID=3060955 RepID=UPI00265D705D|nr:SGNH/GDSL hydrolase family protein [Lactobacillus sp. YT155]MDO1605393.1 SGNH/GDSL hydrolase family protein [Lactobacillus sp. YT155]
MMKRTIGIITLVVIVLAVLGGFYLNQKQTPKQSIDDNLKSEIKLVAVGDSLTEGVGDTTKKGGYVNLIKEKIQKNYDTKVKTENFGIAGETSLQINKRVTKDPKLQKSLKDADVITLTVGGNDLMHILKAKGLALSKKDVSSGTDTFEDNLNDLIVNIRRYNSKSPIYLYSIYNPFGISIKEVKYMNTAVKNWNSFSKQTVSENYNVHFVNVDKLLSNPKKTIKNKDGEAQNPYLSTDDYFHPNNKGYQLMTDELYKQMMKSREDWLEK